MTASNLHPFSHPSGRTLGLGNANSGAKFTPANHSPSGDQTLDAILRGDSIRVDVPQLLAEVDLLYKGGVRYFHWHARNPSTGEQSCDRDLYWRVGKMLRRRYPDLVLSFGASRNGPEIAEGIAKDGEWARLSHVSLRRSEGGADFVTIQAAAELMICLDLERQGFLALDPKANTMEFRRPLSDYVPTGVVETISLQTHSTSKGANYGSTSAREQWLSFANAIGNRKRLNLPQEVEWTQLLRSYALTKLALDHFEPSLGATGRLNITILFGFSPLLPFPMSYAGFKAAVSLARSLSNNQSIPPLDLTITVGAAVMPNQARQLSAPLDVGPFQDSGMVSPLERLLAYAGQPDSGVDVFRFGLEDTPYLLDSNFEVVQASNVELMTFVLGKMKKYGLVPQTNPVALRHFVATEAGPSACTGPDAGWEEIS